tara:strand:+ start:463 stop:1251 length:789 start_codon:yes stop_codon:yes gene_type:complete
MSSLIGGLLISGFLTYCYYSNNPDKARQLATNVSWYIVSGYHRVTFWYEDTFKTRVEEEDSDDENIKMNTGEIEKVKFHGYNNGNVIAHDVLENEVKDLVENYDLCFVGKEIDNKLYFQRLEYENDDFSEDEENVKEEKNEEDEKNEEEESENSEEKNEEEESENSEEKKEESLVPCVRHFLQVECIVGQEKYDIHEHISKYYVTNNLIMDELFMKYFMKQWYDVEMDSSYELKIIDKNISLVTLEKGSKILLGKDEYEIKN